VKSVHPSHENMLSFFDRLWKVVECYVYEASFRKQFPNQFFLGLGSRLYKVFGDLAHTFYFADFV